MELPLENELAFQNIMLRFWESGVEYVAGVGGTQVRMSKTVMHALTSQSKEANARWYTQPALSAESLVGTMLRAAVSRQSASMLERCNIATHCVCVWGQQTVVRKLDL